MSQTHWRKYFNPSRSHRSTFDWRAQIAVDCCYYVRCPGVLLQGIGGSDLRFDPLIIFGTTRSA